MTLCRGHDKSAPAICDRTQVISVESTRSGVFVEGQIASRSRKVRLLLPGTPDPVFRSPDPDSYSEFKPS